MSEFAYDQAPSPGLAMKVASGGQIPRELERQAVAIDELHGLLSHLEERLSPLRLAKPEPASPDRDQPEAIRADLAQAVSNHTTQVLHATRRVQTLLNELEL